MPSDTPVAPVSKPILWTSYVLSALPSLMMIFSGIMKFMDSPKLAEGFAHLQLPVKFATGLGLLELGCVVVYLIPRTAILGAILLTGYLGGAMLTHLRIGEPPIAHVILGVVFWAGLYLREPRLRALIPLRK